MAKSTKPETTTPQTKVEETEAKLISRYGNKIVPGTVRRAPEGSKYGNKMLVDINTVGIDGQPDGSTRTVATSDVFQVHHTEEVSNELRKLRAKEKRASSKADKPKPKRTSSKATKQKRTKRDKVTA